MVMKAIHCVAMALSVLRYTFRPFFGEMPLTGVTTFTDNQTRANQPDENRSNGNVIPQMPNSFCFFI